MSFSALFQLRRTCLGLAWIALLGGCAQPVLQPSPGASYWQGRLALSIASQPPQSMSANFELLGNARQGALILTGPLGQTVARMDWQPGQAILREPHSERHFDSLEALVSQTTRTSLPVLALFDWLSGKEALAAGWQADLSRLSEGRLVARRLQPEPGVELRMLLDPASR